MSRAVCSRFAYVLVLFGLVSLLAHCGGDDTASIELRIASDLVPFYEVGTATATLSDGLANASNVSLGSVERALSDGEPLARGLWLASFDRVPHGVYTAWVTLRRDNGEVLGRKPVTFTLSGDASFTVTITADCVGVDCSSGGGAALFACVAGQCVDPQCTPETPEFCPVGPSPFCETGAPCDSQSPCGVGRCESGVCLQVPDENECGEGEFCSALSGCTLEERPEDAPEDPPGICGDACSLDRRPCFYAYLRCAAGASECEAGAARPAGAPCPNGGVCDAEGMCIEGAREDAGVPADASPVSDTGVSDMDVVSDTGVSDMDVVSDTGVSDMDVVSDTGVSDMGATPCAAGYLGTVETGCYDIDECMYNVCDPLTECTNAPGSYRCSACPDGFAGTGATGCDRENGCDEDPCDALTVCNTTGVGTYLCSPCPSGYLGTGERGCYDIDECPYNVCDPLTDCTNAPGSYACSACPEGYVGTGAMGCDDEDECATNNGGCDPNAVCTNTIGSYVCGPCRSGYADDGESGCYDLNECDIGTDTCADFETCVNLPGSFECEVDCANAYVVVETAADLAPFLECEVLSSLRVLGSDLTTLSLPALREVQELYVLGNASLTSISLPVLGGWVSSEISNNASLVSISLPSLEGSGSFYLNDLPSLGSLALDALTYIYSEISSAPQLETLHFPAANAEHIQLSIEDSGVCTIVVDSAASETEVWFQNNDAVDSLEITVPASSAVKGLNIQHNDSLASLRVTRTAVFGNGEYTVVNNPLLCDVELPNSAAARSWQVAVSGSCPTNICYGRAVLANASDVASVADCDALYSVEVTGALTTLSLPNLVRTVTEEMYLRNQASLTSVSLPLWSGWSEDRAIFAASNLSALTSISIPSAESASIWVQGCPSLRTIDVSAAKFLSLTVSSAPLLDSLMAEAATELETFHISGTALSSISLPHVKYVYWAELMSMPSLTDFDLPSLTSAEAMRFQNLDALTGLSFPALASVGDLSLLDSADIETISAPLLSVIGWKLEVDNNASLESIDMPNLAEVGLRINDVESGIALSSNPVLCSVPPPEQIDTPTYIYEGAVCP